MSLHPPENIAYTTRKEKVYAALNEPSRATLTGKFFSWVLTVLIALNALLVFVVFDNRLTSNVHHVLYYFDVACTFVFLVEYIGRIWTADIAYSHLSPIKARIRYLISPMGIIDFLAVVPFIGVMLGTLPYQTFNTLRVLRVIRLIKITRYISGLNMISRVISSRREEIIPAVAVLAVLVMAASVLMYQFENPVQPDKFDSIFSGMWWAITTITSTGYGDLTPITVEGRLVGMITMLFSICIVAIPAGIFTAGFIDEAHAERERKAALNAEKKRRKEEKSYLKHVHAKHANDTSFAQPTANKACFQEERSSLASTHKDFQEEGSDETHYCPHCGKPL